MSDTTITKEYVTASELFGITLDDVEKLNLNAMKSAFIPHSERLYYIYEIIKPGFQKMKEQLTSLKA
jgi:adenosine deaminase